VGECLQLLRLRRLHVAGIGPSVSVQYDGGTGLIAEAVAAAADADVAIVVVSDAELEGKDQLGLPPGAQNELVERVAAVAKKTVVVVNAGSGLVLPWRTRSTRSWTSGTAASGSAPPPPPSSSAT